MKSKKPKKAAAKAVQPGTIRIRTRDLRAWEKTGGGWRLSKKEFPDAMHVIELFKAHGAISSLTDAKEPSFLKGQFSPDGKCQGARINILPDGRKLDKAYSLFAEHLTVHDESSNTHWDVIYRNPCGKYAYVYALEKKQKSVKRKYREVDEFARLYPTLEANVTKALYDKEDHMAMPMYTLLKTYMRVGNEIYYRAHGHKGLTTLKKKDITISGNKVTFSFLSKGGVPREVMEAFPAVYVSRLKSMLEPLGPSSFVFVNEETGHPLDDKHFKKAFERYCGKEFYPHIVRSYYATQKAREFLEAHRKATKKEIRELYLSIASKLGHKRFVKKDNEWKESYNVTIHHYIRPEVLGRINAIAEGK